MTLPEALAHIEDLTERLAWHRRQLGLAHDATALDNLRNEFGVTPSVARLLASLYRLNGRVMLREMVDDYIPPVIGDHQREGWKLLDVYVYQARQKLGDDAILMVPNVGYRMSAKGLSIVGPVLGQPKASAA